MEEMSRKVQEVRTDGVAFEAASAAYSLSKRESRTKSVKSEHPIGAMEEVSRKVHNANTYTIVGTLPAECTNSHVARDEHRGQSNGAMEEGSRKVLKAREAHARGLVVVYMGRLEGHHTILDKDATSLRTMNKPNKKQAPHRGDGRSVQEGSQSKHAPRRLDSSRRCSW